MPTHPKLIFGAAGIGDEFKTSESVTELLKCLKSNGVTTLDTAALYPPLDIGASERLLGETGAPEDGFKIDTKIMVFGVVADGTLEPAKIETSVNTTFERLKLQHGQKINVLHAHTVDNTTPLKDQAFGFDREFKKGRFEKVRITVWSS